jgi:hypothetical protein
MADKDRKFCIVLYPEDATHLEALQKLRENGYEYAAILHDRDTWSENEPTFDPTKHIVGEKKKPHFHVVLKFNIQRHRTAVAKELGLAPNYLEDCRNLNRSLTYLVHKNYPEKFQYSIDDVEGSLVKQLQKLLDDKTEDERVQQLLSLIDSSGYLEIRDVIDLACENQLYGELRRMGSWVQWILHAHNSDLAMGENESNRRKEAQDWADGIWSSPY